MEDQPKKKSRKRTLWHRLLGDLFNFLLTPLGITVHVELPLMSESPRVDILLLKREIATWTAEQLRRLPDGLRSSRAKHLLLEFKYTQSVNIYVLLKMCGYLVLYQEAQELKDEELELFLISARTPRQKFLDRFQYSEAEAPGVYRSQNELLERIHLIVLNKLRPEPHNAFIKCFASRSNEKRKAFSVIQREDLGALSTRLYWFVTGLWQHWFGKGKEPMREPLTTEEVLEMGQVWSDTLFTLLPPDEVFSHYKPSDAARFYKPEELIREYKPEEVLGQYKPEQRLSGLSLEEIEAYLQSVKASQNKEQA